MPEVADGSWDVAFMSYTLHHFPPPEAALCLRELDRVSGGGLIVVDLRRGALAYGSAAVLYPIAGRVGHPYVTHDGLLSVRRSLPRLGAAAAPRVGRGPGELPDRCPAHLAPPAPRLERDLARVMGAEPRYDVAVIGGGLGGLTTARCLLARGHRVAVLEARRFPFHRLCGEFLSPEFEQLLGAVGFDLGPILERGVPIRRVRFTAPRGRPFREVLPGRALGLSRFSLDHLLAEQVRAAGGDVLDGRRAREIEESADRTAIRTDQGLVTCRRPVVATGKLHGEWRRLLGAPSTAPPAPLMGLKHVGALDGLGDSVEIHAFRGGYCGFTPLEDGAADLCLVARTDVFRDARTPGRFLDRIAAGNPHLGERIRAFRFGTDDPIVQSHFATGAVVDRADALLVGDAGGMISPLAGEGMCLAIRSGRSAAIVLDSHLAGDLTWDRAIRIHGEAMRSEKRWLLTLGEGLQRLLFHPASASAGITTLSALPPLRRWVIRATRSSTAALPAPVRALEAAP